MKKVLKIILIVLLALVLLAAIAFGVLYLLRDRFILDGPGMVNHAVPDVSEAALTRYSYSSGGGMSGGYDLLDAVLTEDGRIRVTEDRVEYYSAPAVVQEYWADAQAFADMHTVFVQNDIASWIFLPDSEYFAYDAPTADFSFDFDNGMGVSFSDRQEIPKGGFDTIRKMEAFLTAYNTEENRIPGLVMPTEEQWRAFETPEGAVTFRAVKYCRNCFYIEINNKSGKTVEYPASCYDLYRLDGSERTLVLSKHYDDYDDTATLETGYCEDNRYEFEQELDAGCYVLVLGDYEIEFELK